ncbi:uncharacterized protein LOC134226151 isoform X2 [Armigeres subalbatus]|uniref:uncharacterized protein LOC134226151 isoform X2 n=1 Tax=Armigeres subalbatus TaxID=124917 RepID=UPI002ED3DA20
MKHECSNCHVWSICYRKLTPKLYDYAAERRIKLDKSCSYICNTCYCRLYCIIKKGNEPAAPSAVNIECENQELTVSEPSKLDDLAVAGPSGTNNFAVAGPSRVNNFAAPANINNGGFEIIDPNAAGSSEIDAVPSVESLFSLESTSAESIGSAGAQKPGDGQEILQQMKAKFDEISDRNDRYRILTSLPKSWTAYKMMQEFGVSQRTAQRAKKLQIEKGFMSTPETRVNMLSLSDDTLTVVRDFYNSDEISRACPGKRDFVIENMAGELLCNLREIYSIFKEQYFTFKIGFSMFSSSRPKNCILAGSSGTPTVCVCIYHQNVKLMFKTLKDKKLIHNHLKTYHDLFFKILCENPTEKCWLKTCDHCPGTQTLENDLMNSLENVDSLEFKQWKQTDRCHLNSMRIISA